MSYVYYLISIILGGPELEPFFNQLAEDLNIHMPLEQMRGPGDSRVFFELGIPTGSIMDYRALGNFWLELLKTYRHTEYDTLDKIDMRSLREAITIGAVSGLRIVNADKWPIHRTPQEVSRAREILFS